jgi:hypothetical protein
MGSRPRPVELIDAGKNQVVAVIRISGRAKLSGVETDLTYAAVYGIRDGRVARGREYATRDEALEAAGLRSSSVTPTRLDRGPPGGVVPQIARFVTLPFRVRTCTAHGDGK